MARISLRRRTVLVPSRIPPRPRFFFIPTQSFKKVHSPERAYIYRKLGFQEEFSHKESSFLFFDGLLGGGVMREMIYLFESWKMDFPSIFRGIWGEICGFWENSG